MRGRLDKAVRKPGQLSRNAAVSPSAKHALHNDPANLMVAGRSTVITPKTQVLMN